MKTSKKKICLVYGGISSEHEVSIKSFENIFSVFQSPKMQKKYNLHVVYISKKGEWFLQKSAEKVSEESSSILQNLSKENFIFWPIMHGEFGENGEFQKLCEKHKIKCIGSNSTSSALAMNKFKAQKVLETNGIICPKSVVLDFAKYKPEKLKSILQNITFPIILKPVDLGSSVGLVKIAEKKIKNVEKEIRKFFKKFPKILLQEFVSGREFTCGILQDKEKFTQLPASEIVLQNTETFDYEAKYTVGVCKEITPADVDRKTMQNLQNTAEKVHKLIGCKDYSRTDMIMRENGEIVVLEINTLPGLTKMSFIPQQLFAKKIGLEKFVNILVGNNL